MSDNDVIPVLFRKFSDGDVIALFPTVPGDSSPRTCSSFMHVGQHGAAGLDLIQITKPARPEEYADLKRELESKPYEYRLKVYRRNQHRWYRERASQL